MKFGTEINKDIEHVTYAHMEVQYYRYYTYVSRVLRFQTYVRHTKLENSVIMYLNSTYFFIQPSFENTCPVKLFVILHQYLH
jgi:hypothetical protein